jgi:hypothetical protein
MTDVKILFDGVIAEEAVKGTFLVRKDGKLLSPFEYDYFFLADPQSLCTTKG